MIRKGLHRSEPQRFSRQWWISGARNLLWVAVVTVLVWAYADMRFTDRRTLQTTIRLTASPGSTLTLLKNDVPVESVTQRVEVKLEGSRERLDRVQGQFGEPIDWDVSQDHGPGESDISLYDIVASTPAVVRNGLRVISTAPAFVTIRIARLVHEAVPVELSVRGADLVQQPKVPPVTITVTEQQWEQILQAQPTPVLKTKEVDLANREAGKVIPLEFEIFPEIAGVPVKLDRNTVTVPVEIRQRTSRKNFVVTVRVLMLLDWSDAAQYDLVKKDPLEWRPQIIVTGSQTDLDKLDARDIDAYVVLREDDKKPMETWTTRAVIIRFPPGLQVQLAGDPPQVSFRLDKRTEEPAAP